MASKALELLQRFRGLKEEGSKPKRIDEIDPLFKDEYAIGSTKFLLGQKLEDFTRDELKAHLAARKLPVDGSKAELIERLKGSIEHDVEHEQSYVEELDEERRVLADLEERGSVYAVGCNTVGQLGVGDHEPRTVLTVVPKLLGMGVSSVTAGLELTFAVTEDHHVYVWGSMGLGPTGNSEKEPKDETPDHSYNEPRRVEFLKGEEVVSVSVGASHAAALSAGGDCFMWGVGSYGRLGFGHLRPVPVPTLLIGGLPKDTNTRQVCCGQSHTMLLTGKGTCYAWGHVADGRLGVGTAKRLGVKEPECRYFPTPTLLSAFKTQVVTQISCGAAHTLAVTAEGQVWSWGCGGGGRLGHGDVRDRFSPTLVEELRGSVVTDVAAGLWHSAALVHVPPLARGRMVYTWGSGYCGQLGQGSTLVSLRPSVVQHLLNIQVFAVILSCGTHHIALIDQDGELWTWGSNRFHCLGRTIDETDVEYTAIPGHVGGFGSIVDRVGRGMPRAVACGKEFMVVATYPYQGPSEEVAQQMMEERRLREQEEALRLEQDALLARKLEKQVKNLQKQQDKIKHATAKRLCVKCKACPGFQYNAIKQSICRECGHSSVHHMTAEEMARLHKS